MELFEVIPASLFTVLTSKNRELYAQGLLIVRDAFNNEIMLDRYILENTLSSKLQNELLNLDNNQEEGFNEDDLRDIHTRSKFLVKRFIETGWLETEYAKGSKLQEYLTIPDYAIKLLDIIKDFCNEEVKQYDAFMYSMYSSLVSADKDYPDYRYTALDTVYNKIQEFEVTLKALFTNLRRHYSRLTRLKTVNQMLQEHFDSYQKDVVKQIYLPLKTKDSIARFKGPILDIISKWLRDPEIVEQLVTQAIIQRHFKNRETASDDVIGKINFITDKLSSLQDLLNSIDERNNEYVTTATDKMRFLLRNDKSIKGKLTKIIEKLGQERLSNVNDGVELISSGLTIGGAAFMSEDSLYNRANAEKDYTPTEESALREIDDTEMSNEFEQMQEDAVNRFSNENIIKYMHEQMDEINRLQAKDVRLENMNNFIMFIYSFIKGFDQRVFYKIEMRDGNIVNNKYSIPDIDFVRRKEN